MTLTRLRASPSGSLSRTAGEGLTMPAPKPLSRTAGEGGAHRDRDGRVRA